MRLTRRPSCNPAPRRWRRLRLARRARPLARRAAQAAPERAWKHGLSLFGDLKYPAGFKHFDYVNAERAEGRRGAADRRSAPSTISTWWSPA